VPKDFHHDGTIISGSGQTPLFRLAGASDQADVCGLKIFASSERP
jgi:hypothetical protein